MITNPVTTTPDATVAEVDALCGALPRRGPARSSTTTGKLVGIITNRDMRFVSAVREGARRSSPT